jgi:hypothetical protein
MQVPTLLKEGPSLDSVPFAYPPALDLLAHFVVPLFSARVDDDSRHDLSKQR